MIKPTLDEIASHCKQAINMALNKDGETSYTLSFDVKATEKDLKFIFYSPSALLLNQELQMPILILQSFHNHHHY